MSSTLIYIPDEVRPLLHLLDDTDTTVTTAVQSKLISYGSSIVPILRMVLDRERELNKDKEDDTVFTNAQSCIRALQTDALAEAVGEMYDAFDAGKDLNLESVCIAISRFGCPETDAVTLRSRLDEIALEVHKYIVESSNLNDLTMLMCLNREFFEERQFKGATKNYYSPEHSYLAHVLETRRGIPLSLSLVYLLVAERVGIDLDGIGMPLHFLVYHPMLNVYIDAFNQGAFLSREDCEKFVRESGFSFGEKMLTRSSNKIIVQRLLRNLVYAHTKHQQSWEAEILQKTLDDLVRNTKDG